MNHQYHLPLPSLDSMKAEDFLTATSNAEAVRQLFSRDPTSWPSHALILWGPEGSGKTHLLTAWCEKSHAQRVEAGDPILGKIINGKHPAPAYALDNADAIAGNAVHEEWLQHFYNATKAASLPFLLASRKPPAAWGLTLHDIETRIKSCSSVALAEPDDELMRGLLMKHFSDRQLMVDAGVVDYLAIRLERTGTAVRKTVALLDNAALAAKCRITVPFVQRTLTQHQPKPEDDHDEDA